VEKNLATSADPHQPPSTALAPFDMGAYLAGIRAPEALTTQRELAAAYDAACTALIGPNDVQRGEKGRVFKKKSAWRKLARHFRISVAVAQVQREVLADGHFLATVTARAIAPWGQAYEEVGACCTDEATGRRVITVADAIATAATRAANRAISNLIAMGEVTADELGDRKGGVPAGVDGDGVVQDDPGDAGDEDAITSSTPFPYGKLQGKPVKDWPLPMLKWAIAPGRNFGPRTDEWQQVSREELQRREAKPA